MPSELPKKPQPPVARRTLGMLDALIGGPAAPDQPGRNPKGRSVLLAHALAQRENRLVHEKLEAASRLNKKSDRDDATPDTRPAPRAVALDRDRPAATTRPVSAKPAAPTRPAAAERPSLDAMIVKALGASARGHVKDGAFDRQAALADLIARTQTRLNGGGKPEPEASRAPAPRTAAARPPVVLPAELRGDREAMIAAAMRTHRRQQDVFGELSLRQRATLRATAEAMMAKGARPAK